MSKVKALFGFARNGRGFTNSKENGGQPGRGRKTAEPKPKLTSVANRSDEDGVKSQGFSTVETRCS